MPSASVEAPAAITLGCDTCGEERTHRVLHGRLGTRTRVFEGTVKCTQCGTVRQVRHQEAKPIELDLHLSWMDKTERRLVHLLADFWFALQGNQIFKAPAFGHNDKPVLTAAVAVRHVFDEQKHEDVILVLGGVHAPPEFVTALPDPSIQR